MVTILVDLLGVAQNGALVVFGVELGGVERCIVIEVRLFFILIARVFVF